ncbi:hypothetical protein CFELI_10815 [Corynebacterium felinum]|nr:hypothetical protein CFELI_10815 [Corynebacterium felinum]
MQLQDDKSLGFEFNRSTLTAVRELCDLASMDGVTGIEFGVLGSPVNMDSRIAENASKALASVRLSLGSVRGKLYRFNGRTLPYKGGIEDCRTGKAVHLEIDVEHVGAVLQLMQQEVRVWGILSRDPITNEVVSVKVKGVDAITAKKRLPRPAYEVQGILGAKWLDGMQPDEFVRREREA